MDGYIYGLIDPRNDKIKYVGQTKWTLNKRYCEHLRNAKYKKTKYLNLYMWINKLKNIDLLPIIKKIENVDVEFLNEREKYWISYYGKQLINVTKGGAGINFIEKRKFTKEHRKKIGDSCRGKKHYRYGKSAHNIESICKLSKKTGKIIKKYLSIKDAYIDTNVKQSAISSCLSNNRNSAGGFIWIRKCDVNNNILIKNKINLCTKYPTNEERSIKVEKYDILTNKLLKKYKSFKEAGRDNNSSDSTIIAGCRKNKGNISLGFKWKEIKN